ncbi:hypothetical protein REPUB_Repub05bG0037900 [Reevesia pubescens]
MGEEKKRKRGKVSDENGSEINAIFDGVKRRKKSEKSCEENITLFVKKAMAEFEIVVEDDAQLNRKGQPAINKLMKLPLLVEVLRKKSLQLEFLDHGVLTLLKSWLEPLPDGSLPNANIRAAILNVLTDFPIDLELPDHSEQLKSSGLGKAIMFLSKSDEEIASNKKVAKDLVEKWSRTIFNKSTKFSDLRNIEDHNVPFMKKLVKKSARPATIEYREVDLDFDVAKEQKPSSRPFPQRVSIPEASSSVYVVRPQSNYSVAKIKALYAGQLILGDDRQRIIKRLKQLKASKKKPLQAYKPSANGRGMFISV